MTSSALPGHHCFNVHTSVPAAVHAAEADAAERPLRAAQCLSPEGRVLGGWISFSLYTAFIS